MIGRDRAIQITQERLTELEARLAAIPETPEPGREESDRLLRSALEANIERTHRELLIHGGISLGDEKG